MNAVANELANGLLPRWRLACLGGLALLSLCSCRAPHAMGPVAPPMNYSTNPTSLPERAFTGGPEDDPRMANVGMGPCDQMQGVPHPEITVTEWAPPGILQPWPQDEYLHDGGDGQIPTAVATDDVAHGVELQDTIVHYQTIDGRRVVVPSNQVDIYAPRFAAVRHVENAEMNQQTDGLTEYAQPVKLVQHEQERLASTAIQPLKPFGDTGVKQPIVQQQNARRGVLAIEAHLAGFAGGFLPYEDLQAVRQGLFRESEQGLLLAGTTAAITWTNDKAVQIILERAEAHEEISDQKVQKTYTIDTPNHPRLRVIKIASTNAARPGDEVDFTIRFDNIGDQRIENVTLIDNLTTRLEYIENSAQASRPAEFSSRANEGDSLELRWELTEPLKAGEGGLVRFHCRVR